MPQLLLLLLWISVMVLSIPQNMFIPGSAIASSDTTGGVFSEPPPSAQFPQVPPPSQSQVPPGEASAEATAGNIAASATTTITPPAQTAAGVAVGGAATNSTPTSVDSIQVAYAVRWFDPNVGLFGCTMNITFINTNIFSQRWYLRMRMADPGTDLQEYWGSWNTTQLTKSWYQITPGQSDESGLGELSLDATNTIYFSFNGNWSSTTSGDWNTTRMAVDAMDFQYWLTEDLTKEPVLKHLKPPEEFANVPIPFETSAEPFGNFIRSGRNGTKYPQKMMTVQAEKLQQDFPTSNFVGMKVCLPLLGCFIALILVGTVNRLRWRQRFRKQFLERARMRGQGLAKAAKVVDHAVAPSYSVSAPTYRDEKIPLPPPPALPPPPDAFQDASGAVGQVVSNYRRGTTVLEPGLQYRMSVYQQTQQYHQEIPLPPMRRFVHESGMGSPRLATFDYDSTNRHHYPSSTPAYEPPRPSPQSQQSTGGGRPQQRSQYRQQSPVVGSLPGYEE